MCDLVTNELNRTVGGWEEYAFETGVAKPGVSNIDDSSISDDSST